MDGNTELEMEVLMTWVSAGKIMGSDILIIWVLMLSTPADLEFFRFFMTASTSSGVTGFIVNEQSLPFIISLSFLHGSSFDVGILLFSLSTLFMKK